MTDPRADQQAQSIEMMRREAKCWLTGKPTPQPECDCLPCEKGRLTALAGHTRANVYDGVRVMPAEKVPGYLQRLKNALSPMRGGS